MVFLLYHLIGVVLALITVHVLVKYTTFLEEETFTNAKSVDKANLFLVVVLIIVGWPIIAPIGAVCSLSIFVANKALKGKEEK